MDVSIATIRNGFWKLKNGRTLLETSRTIYLEFIADKRKSRFYICLYT